MTTTAINRAADRVLLSGRIRYFSNRKLLIGNARLFFDRIEIAGWSWAGRVSMTVPIGRIHDVAWWTLTSDGPNLALESNNGDSLAFWVKSPGIWHFRILELLAPERPRDMNQNLDRLVSAA